MVRTPKVALVMQKTAQLINALTGQVDFDPRRAKDHLSRSSCRSLQMA